MRPAVLLLAAATLATALPLGAQMPDLPPSRPGLWELTSTMEKPKATPSVISKMCLDPASEREFMDYVLKLSEGNCKGARVKREGKSLVVESDCSFRGRSAKTRSVLTGDFQSAYTVRMEGTVERGGDKPPQEMLTKHTLVWKSADCPGMKPGDMTIMGGLRVNIKQIKGLSGLIR